MAEWGRALAAEVAHYWLLQLAAPPPRASGSAAELERVRRADPAGVRHSVRKAGAAREREREQPAGTPVGVEKRWPLVAG